MLFLITRSHPCGCCRANHLVLTPGALLVCERRTVVHCSLDADLEQKPTFSPNSWPHICVGTAGSCVSGVCGRPSKGSVMNAISASRNSQMLCASFGTSAAATKVRAAQHKLQFLMFSREVETRPCALYLAGSESRMSSGPSPQPPLCRNDLPVSSQSLLIVGLSGRWLRNPGITSRRRPD